MKIIDHFSPNSDSREGHAVDMLVLHYTGMASATQALERLCCATSKVSAHYMVDEDGTTYCLVPEDRRAWHAGVSTWRGTTNINQRSIGIEIVNPGHEFGYRPFPAAQMKMLAMLAREIITQHKIPARNVVAHSDIAPARKEDPGELFDWQTMAKLGIGLWPKDVPAMSSIEASMLAKYGYDISDLPKAITAFQRHFRPKSMTGQWDSECARLLESLLKMS